MIIQKTNSVFKLRQLSSFAVIVSFCIPVYAETAGRINAQQVDDRCAKRPISDETCKEKREKAILRDCITQPEYELLKKYNLCPSCNWDKRGLSAYQGYCPAGCFARGTRILVKDLADGSTRWEPIEVVVANTDAFEVWSVMTEKNSVTLAANPIRMGVVGPEEFPLVHILTNAKTGLNVTSRHAVLLGSGEMVAAETLREGDVLAHQNGSHIFISSIERISTDDDVFNLLLDVEAPLSHTIITEGGFITGDQYWQGELEDLLGTQIVSQ